MQDVRLQADENGIYDLVLGDGDFNSVDGFETAIATSYFTDSRAPSVQVQAAQNRRGWVGNILYADIERELGGLLWVLDQARITDDTLNLAKTFAQDSLAWMVEDGIARNVAVSVEKAGYRTIKILTNVTTLDNTVLRYVTLWKNTGAIS